MIIKNKKIFLDANERKACEQAFEEIPYSKGEDLEISLKRRDRLAELWQKIKAKEMLYCKECGKFVEFYNSQDEHSFCCKCNTEFDFENL